MAKGARERKLSIYVKSLFSRTFLTCCEELKWLRFEIDGGALFVCGFSAGNEEMWSGNYF
jgi:hypothetical protein